MNSHLRRVFSRFSRDIACFSSGYGASRAVLAAKNAKTFYKFPLASYDSTFLSGNTSLFRRGNQQGRWFSQMTGQQKVKIPDELWALFIIGAGGVAVFAFTVYRKREIAIKRQSNLRIKLAEAKQCIDKEEKEAAYDLLQQVLHMIHVEIAEKEEKEKSSNKPQTHRALRFVLDQSANLASELQKWDEAEHLYRLTLQEYLSSGTPLDDDAVIEVSLKLSQACEHQNKLSLALGGYKWCVKTAESKVDGLDEPTDNSKALLGVCLDGLGTFLLTNGHASQAIQVFSRSLEVAKEVLGPNDEQTLVIMNNLAKAYADCGQYEDAERVARDTIELAEQSQSSFMATFLANKGAILMEKGNIKKAKKALIEALKLAEESDNEEAKALIKSNMYKLEINV